MWRESPLGNLAEITSGGTPARDIPAYWGGDIPWVTPTDVTACRTNYLFDTVDRITAKGLLNSSAKILPAGSILLTSRATVGLAKIAAVPVSTNQGFKSLTPQDADGEFLFYQVQRLRGTFERYAAGSTFAEINKKDTARILIPHPVDQHEQRKIAAILSSVDTAIEKTEALIDKYQQIRTGLMHDLFTRGVLSDGELRPPFDLAPQLYQRTEIGWLPRQWTPKTLRSLVGASNIINGPFGSDLLTSELKAEGVPVLYVQDVKPGYFNRVARGCVSAQKADTLAFCSVRRGDILVAKVGSPPCDSCVYPFAERAIVTQDVIRIRPGSAVNGSYLSCLLNSPYGREVVKRISIEGTRERVSLTEFKDLVLPIPGDTEQRLIANRVQGVERLITGEFAVRDKLVSQKLGLMQDLLTGKVPVKVDEPIAEATDA